MNVTKVSLEGIKKMQSAIFCFQGKGIQGEESTCCPEDTLF
jgi:hypothetical protein